MDADHPSNAPAGRLPSLVVTRSQVDQRTRLAYHRHTHHLIVWATSATVTVRADARDWLVPPTHAVWIPAGTPHAAEVLRPGDSCTITVDADRSPVTWVEPLGIVITPLVRELIVHLDRNPRPGPTRTRVESLLLDLLEPTAGTSLNVPLPTDPRIRAIADRLIADPADQRDLAAWGHEVGAGVRTLTRLFSSETGMTFARWRTHVRIRAALTHLAHGTSIGATARAVGYRKPGAFSEAFFRVTGQPPSRWLPLEVGNREIR